MGSTESKVSSPPKQTPVVPLLDTIHNEVNEDGLPTYAPTAIPSQAVTYRFARCSPFAMVLVEDKIASPVEDRGLYHISVGVNIWMPSCTVTTVRRGSSETGSQVAQLE